MVIIGAPPLATIKLIIVVLGLFPGATQFGCPFVKLNISLRVLIAKPSSEKNTDLSKAPPLGVAQANDRLEPKQMISASGTIVLVFSVFAALGPFTMSYFLELFEMFGFMLYMGIVHLVIAVTVLMMMMITENVDESDQTDFQVMGQPSVVAMEVIAEEALESQSEQGTT